MNKIVSSTRFFTLVVCALGLSFSTCTKKEIQGPKGEAGTPGGGGNSNINSTAIITITGSSWKTNKDSTEWWVTVKSTLLTQNVVDQGAAKIYVLRSDSWWELPYLTGDLILQYGFRVDSLHLAFSDSHGDLPDRPLTSDYRIVTISGANKNSLPVTNAVESINDNNN